MKIDKARMRRTKLRRAQVLLLGIDRTLTEVMNLTRNIKVGADTLQYIVDAHVVCARAHDSIGIDMEVKHGR